MMEPMDPASSPSLDMVTAALRADSSDIAIYARVLTESLGDALPPDCVTVDRDRSVSDRMKGRPRPTARAAGKGPGVPPPSGHS